MWMIEDEGANTVKASRKASSNFISATANQAVCCDQGYGEVEGQASTSQLPPPEPAVKMRFAALCLCLSISVTAQGQFCQLYDATLGRISWSV